MSDWVVRGGIADWENLRDAYIIDRRMAPPVFGFSALRQKKAP